MIIIKKHNYKQAGVWAAIFMAALLLFAIIYDFCVRIDKLYNNSAYYSLGENAAISSDWFMSQISHEHNVIRIASKSISEAEGYYLNNDVNMVEILKAVCNNSNFQRVVFTDLSGEQITNFGEAGNAKNTEYFNLGLIGQELVSDPFISNFADERCIVVSSPVIREGKVIGIIHGTYYIDSKNELFLDSEYKSDAYGYIVDANGGIIFQSYHGDKINEENDLFSFFSKVSFEDDFTLQQLRTDVKNGANGTFGYKYQGKHRYVSFTPVGINEWYSVTVTTGATIAYSYNGIKDVVVETSIKLILIGTITAVCMVLYRKRKEHIISTLNNELMEEIERAYLDPVIDHYNYFRFKLKAAELFSENPDKNYAIIFSNIKNFKYINDAYGFECGNDVLRKCKEWLQQNKAVLYARVSADNFVSINEYDTIENVRKNSQEVNNIRFDVSEIIDGLSEIVVNAGVYCIQKHENLLLETMIDRARMALNKSKDNSSIACVVYEESYRQNIFENQRMENRMNKALEDNEFKLFIQPKINSKENRIVACEALARWDDPERGIISPIAFIPLFEHNGFIRQLDTYMFRNVCKLVRKWIDTGVEVIPVSVNVSKTLLYCDNFVKEYLRIKGEYNIPDGLIEVEFTESVITDDKKRMVQVLEEFQRNGITCAIDDFGSGYSSLNLLKDVKADVIKIDKEFFSTNEYNQREKTIIKNVVSMANELSIQIVAEGVEHEEQVVFLNSINCFVVQGFIYDKPMPQDEFEKKYIK